jgi:TolB protein
MKRILAVTFLLIGIASAAAGQSKYGLLYNVAQDTKADDYEIYAMNLDGSNKRNITNHKDVAWTYYSYKKTVFFISDRDACKRCYFLHSMDFDGRNIRKISDLRLEDSWMGSRNDGTEMVVSGRVGNDVRYQLFIIDIKTGKYRQITDEPAAAFRDPSFSPDGKRIVYAYKKERTNREVNEELYIMNVDGSQRVQLTTYPKDDKTAEWHAYHAGPPRWVKKHNFITYNSVQAGKSSLYAVTPDGKRNWKLTNNELPEGWHDWSPDGKWLAIGMNNKEETEYGIWIMNWKTKELKKLTDSALFKYQHAPVFVER